VGDKRRSEPKSSWRIREYFHSYTFVTQDINRLFQHNLFPLLYQDGSSPTFLVPPTPKLAPAVRLETDLISVCLLPFDIWTVHTDIW
jgi:hypothetical protein